MQRIEQSVTIEATQTDVWNALADLRNMRHYMPGLETVELLGEASGGVGASRYCVFEDGVELEERIVEWNEGDGYVLETAKAVKVPMKTNRVSFRLAEDDGVTTVTQSMEYAMKGGLVAPLIEKAVSGRMRSATANALNGLKGYVESSQAEAG